MLIDNDFVKSILEKINIHKRLYLGYSGGIDSSVLLHILNNNLKKKIFKLTVIHINHSYNINSKNWSTFCKNECNKLKIPIYIYNYNSFNKKLLSENDFRKLRFNIFLKIIKKNSSLILAHNNDDKIETFFLNIIRNSSANGLSSIKTTNKLKHINLIRPLLNVSKKEIYNYANKNKIKYIIDKSNFEIKFSRNFIRNEILFKLNSKFQKIEKNLNSEIILFEYFYCYIFIKLIKLKKRKRFLYNILPISYLIKLSKFWFYEIVKFWIKNLFFKSPSKNILNILEKKIPNLNEKNIIIKTNKYFLLKTKKYLLIHLNYKYNNFYFVYLNKFYTNINFYSKFKFLIDFNKIFNRHNKKKYTKINFFKIYIKKKCIIVTGLWITENFYNKKIIFKNLIFI